MKTKVIVQNLKCGGCAHTISTKIAELNGVENVEITVENSTVGFTYKNEDNLISVKDKLSSLGYPIEGDKNSLTSKVKSFVSCATGKISK